MCVQYMGVKKRRCVNKVKTKLRRKKNKRIQIHAPTREREGKIFMKLEKWITQGPKEKRSEAKRNENENTSTED